MLQDLPEYSDLELAGFIRKDDPDAFMELMKRYIPLIRAKAARYQNATAFDADDLCQEGLLGLFRAACTYDPHGPASFRTYAGICISHRIIAAYRSYFRQKHFALNSSVSIHDENAAALEDQVSSPETVLIAQENLQMVHDRIRRYLSHLEQRVLFLYMGGCSYSEIAGKLEISSKSVDNAMQRVRRKLRDPSV